MAAVARRRLLRDWGTFRGLSARVYRVRALRRDRHTRFGSTPHQPGIGPLGRLQLRNTLRVPCSFDGGYHFWLSPELLHPSDVVSRLSPAAQLRPRGYEGPPHARLSRLCAPPRLN